MALDIRTLLLVLAMINLAMALTLWVAFSGDFRDGLHKWIASALVQSAGWGLFATRGWFPDLLTVELPYTLLTLSFSLQAAALIEFQGRRAPPWLVFGPTILILSTLVAAHGRMAWQAAASNTVWIACFVFIVWLLVRDRTSGIGRARWLMIAAYGAAAAVSASRIVTWLIDADAFKTTATLPQALAFLGAVLIVLLVSIAFLLMHKERSDEAIRRLATTDPLTGVFNRRTFIELAERELARCRRSGDPLQLLMLDLDHFKRVNDTYGHVVGDEVLSGFARVVTGCLRRTDLLVRYGGEEFCILLPGADGRTAAALAERVRSTVEATPIATRSGPVSITVSIGICGDQASDIASLDRLLDCADSALYEAKKGGRNRVVAPALTPQASGVVKK